MYNNSAFTPAENAQANAWDKYSTIVHAAHIAAAEARETLRAEAYARLPKGQNCPTSAEFDAIRERCLAEFNRVEAAARAEYEPYRIAAQ